jgi:hypothetical protein
MKRWTPRIELTRKERFILKRLKRIRKLFAFLRLHRHELFDDSFQDELEKMYRCTGAGEEPIPPAFLCMVLIIQGYLQISDAEAVELALLDMRWQMALDCYGIEEPPFSQGALQQFRERLIATDMDRRLLERTRELAKKSNGFDWKKLPKDLRVGVDSRPLLGAGRVEDTFNLLGHSARKIVECVATTTGQDFMDVCRAAGIPLLCKPSIKAGLDVNWNDPEQRDWALNVLLDQVTSLHAWLLQNGALSDGLIQKYIDAVAQVHAQDIEETKGGRAQLRQGVAPDRRISIEDAEMRHGRKSKSKRFDGYKEHVAADLDTDLILACAITPANRPEEEAMPRLQEDMVRQKIQIRELNIDRAYINSPVVEDIEATGGEVVCKSWSGRNSRADKFNKSDFKIDMRNHTITCPVGQVEYFEPGQTVEFNPEACGSCPLRGECTHSASGRGRTVHIAEDERRQQRLRKLQGTGTGRERLRGRTGIEHRLAHIAARKGPKARYRGIRKNRFDLRRAAIIQNLETIQRKTAS